MMYHTLVLIDTVHQSASTGSSFVITIPNLVDLTLWSTTSPTIPSTEEKIDLFNDESILHFPALGGLMPFS